MGFGGSEIQIVGNVFQCRRRRNVIMPARAKTQFGVLYTARRRSLHGHATITTDGYRGGGEGRGRRLRSPEIHWWCVYQMAL